MKKNSFERKVIFITWQDIWINALCVLGMFAVFVLLGALFLIKYP